MSMNEHRAIWSKARGPIPKGWLVHHLNGNTVDNRLENLAAVPRHPIHMGQITAPYVSKIRKLERELKLLKEEK